MVERPKIDRGAALALLDARAQPDAADAAGETPLIAAAKQGGTAVVQLLLAHGADAGLRDRAGMTALAHARARHRADIAALLSAPR